MRKFNYECNNSKCESQEVKVRTWKTSTGTISRAGKDNKFSYEKEDNEINSPEYCPYCEEPLTKIGESCAVFLGTSLMSIQQKQQMLMNRSKAHERTGAQRDNRAEKMMKNNKEFGV